jgi:hypothetical protein
MASRSKQLASKGNALAKKGNARARKASRRGASRQKSRKDKRSPNERLFDGIVDGLAVAGAVFVGGSKIVADLSRAAEKSRCRAIVAARAHRAPKLIQEILDAIDDDDGPRPLGPIENEGD